MNGDILPQSGNKPRIIVYSALFGNFESIKEPLIIDKSAEYILFTDDINLRSKRWNIVRIHTKERNFRRASRMPKILSHQFLPDHDLSLYMDQSMQLRSMNIYKMMERCLEKHDIALYRHPVRNCTYKEINHCIKVKKANPQIAYEMIVKYRKEGFPGNYGLFENGLIIRRNTVDIQRLNEFWWKEYASGDERDQFSLMYSLWKLGMTPNAISIGKQMRINPYVIFVGHRK